MAIAGLRRRLPPGAAFSGRTAAWLHGFDGWPGVPPEVTVPYGCGVSARACMSLRHGTLTDTDVVQLRGFPATSPLRTAFDLSRRLPLVDAVAAVDAALHNRTVKLAEFRSYVVEHSRCAGVAQARRVAELADASAESPMETRLRMLLVLAGLPPPQAQVPLYDDRGRFLGRPDLYYRSSVSASSTMAALIATVSWRTTVARTVCSAQASASFGSQRPTCTTPLTRLWLKSTPPLSALFPEKEPIHQP